MGRKTKPQFSLAQWEKTLGEGRIVPGKEKIIGELRGMVRVMKEQEKEGSYGGAGDGDNKGFRGNREKVVG